MDSGATRSPRPSFLSLLPANFPRVSGVGHLLIYRADKGQLTQRRSPESTNARFRPQYSAADGAERGHPGARLCLSGGVGRKLVADHLVICRAPATGYAPSWQPGVHAATNVNGCSRVWAPLDGRFNFERRRAVRLRREETGPEPRLKGTKYVARLAVQDRQVVRPLCNSHPVPKKGPHLKLSAEHDRPA